VPGPPAVGTPVLAGQHVELPRLGLNRPIAVQSGEDAVPARVASLDHLAGSLPERREDAVTGCDQVSTLAVSEVAWSSCRLRGSASCARWAKIARAAAEAPVIVVMHGSPWRTAALRIS
jgi:hypothetical protein